MITQIITRTAALALLVAAFLLTMSVPASAQEQGSLSISNNASCAVTVCGPKGGNCITISPGSSITLQVPCEVTTLTVEICGKLRKMSLGECLTNVSIGSCCANICYVPGIRACTAFLSIDPSSSLRCPCLSGLE